MSEQVIEEVDDLEQPTVDGEMVHWMEPRPMSVGPAGVSVTAGAAFTLGVVAAVATLALLHWLGPERVIEVRRRPRA
ncbi:MAG TPA: hypothetical protein VHN39_06875 [Phenylobacterium sp.]|jgi:hypothetical protein|nr:hypothetical protein [Phenylobacterium sp.]